jgi:nucleotide-binding universal stress UspA family protein
MNDSIGRIASGDLAARAVHANSANELGEYAGSEEVAARRRLRQSYEAGHRPKFLVLVDDTEYCAKAVYYASRRAVRVGAKVLLLRVIEPPPGELTMLGVADVMRIEAQQEAQQLLDRFASISESIAIEPPETAIREGYVAGEIFQLIQADEDIAMLVLAAGTAHQNPGPIVAELGRTAGTYPVPVVIVPAHLSDTELDALS